MKRCLEPGGPDLPGGEELRRTLFTLPTHSRVTRRDLEQMIDWLRVPLKVLTPLLCDATASTSGSGGSLWRRGGRS